MMSIELARADQMVRNANRPRHTRVAIRATHPKSGGDFCRRLMRLRESNG
jgi:hypothetical protein